MKRIVAQELDSFPIWPHTLKYHPVSGALIATGAVPGEEGGHYVAVWTKKTSTPTQCYKRERPSTKERSSRFLATANWRRSRRLVKAIKYAFTTRQRSRF